MQGSLAHKKETDDCLWYPLGAPIRLLVWHSDNGIAQRAFDKLLKRRPD